MIQVSEIRAERARRYWSQKDLAEKANVSLSTIQKIERGDIMTVLMLSLKKVADALEIDV
jgi:transcriptional regulator with XRE-family HTH domain